jgi:hypothetical protein
MKEANIIKLVQIALSSIRGVRLFRNNTGQAWTGIVVERTAARITLAEYRPLHAGLVKGSSDLVGWRSVTITPEMVGKQVAVFTAIEAKTQTGRATNEQMIFLENVKAAGGFAGVARSPEDARKIIESRL